MFFMILDSRRWCFLCS